MEIKPVKKSAKNVSVYTAKNNADPLTLSKKNIT